MDFIRGDGRNQVILFPEISPQVYVRVCGHSNGRLLTAYRCKVAKPDPSRREYGELLIGGQKAIGTARLSSRQLPHPVERLPPQCR